MTSSLVRDGAQVHFEMAGPRVARITLARPAARNAQGLQMTYELDAALQRAALDDEIRAIILAGEGPHFCAGHDLGGDHGKTWRDYPVIGTWAGFDEGGAAARYAREREIYLDICERWRALPKPTIAAVNGKCIGGGLMIAWCCDLIVAADDAQFQDPTLSLGLSGVEFFMHPAELGFRRAKEWLFTTGLMTAQEACAAGMVNRVVPADTLQAIALELAAKIATKPRFALQLAKQAVNQAQDGGRRRLAVDHAFALHHLLHTHNEQVWGFHADPNGMPDGVREKFLRRMQALRQLSGGQTAQPSPPGRRRG